jgi:hypothetical protein
MGIHSLTYVESLGLGKSFVMGVDWATVGSQLLAHLSLA